MAYIGIDQSYSGFAMTILRRDETHETVVKKFDPKKHGTGVNRLLVIEDWVQNTLWHWEDVSTDQITHVCMEGYSAGSKFGREVAGELGYAVKRAVYDHFADAPGPTCYPTIVQPTSLKKYITGKGNAKKNEILLAVYRKWGVEFSDDNAADSYGLAHIAWDIENDCSTLAYEEEVVKALKPHTERLAA